MITKLKSTKEVSINLVDPSIKKIIYCGIELFVQSGDEYRYNGTYYYLIPNENPNPGEDVTFTEVPVRNFSHTLTLPEVNELYITLDIQYPVDSSYTEKRTIDITSGAMYVVSVVPVFGLTGDDWIVDN